MTSLKDVAKLAGVSVGAVSRYLNEPERLRESTRRRIQPAIEALNYSPNALAQSLRRGKTGLVMVICSAIGDPYFGDVIHGIQRVAKERGVTILVREVRSINERPSEASGIVLSRAADGVIVLGSNSPFDLTDDVHKTVDHPPVVVGGEIVSGALQRMPSVRIDNVAAAEELTRYLIGLGHRRFAFIAGEPDSPMLDDREIGFRKALAEGGIAIVDDLLLHGDLIVDGGHRAMRQLMSLPDPPTAVVCVNDEMAIGAMSEARAMGLTIPDDVSIVGFDDIRYAEAMNPPLTTVAQPAEMIGERCFKRLMKALAEPGSESGVEIVPHKVVIRESAGPPRQ